MEDRQASDDSSDDERHSNHSSDEEDVPEDATDSGGPGSVEAVRQALAARLRLGQDDDQKHPAVLETLDFEGIVTYIKEGRAKNIITMAGAGISTSAGLATLPLDSLQG